MILKNCRKIENKLKVHPNYYLPTTSYTPPALFVYASICYSASTRLLPQRRRRRRLLLLLQTATTLIPTNI